MGIIEVKPESLQFTRFLSRRGVPFFFRLMEPDLERKTALRARVNINSHVGR